MKEPRRFWWRRRERRFWWRSKEDSDEGAEKEDSDEGAEKGVRGGPPPPPKKKGQIQLDHKVIIKGPKFDQFEPPPPPPKKKKKKKKGSLATGLSTKEISDEGWMDDGVLGHFYALSRLNWAGDNLG